MTTAEKAKYFKKGTAFHKEPGSMGARYCRCLMHTAAKQADWCLREKAFPKRVQGKIHHIAGVTMRGGKKCYNPYAICTASVKRKGNVECSAHFDYDQVPQAERAAYKLLTARKPGAKPRRKGPARPRSTCAGKSRKTRPNRAQCAQLAGCMYITGKRASYCRKGTRASARTLLTGKRGGRYYVTKSGRRRYVTGAKK